MNDDEVERSIAAFEQALTIEDPGFVHRLEHVAHRDDVHAIVISLLLALGAVLLTIGVGTMSGHVWAGGLGLFLLCLGLDCLYKRRLRRDR